MITNSRLLAIRATGIDCQTKVDTHVATHLEKDFAELFQICLDNLPERNASLDGSKVNGSSAGPHLNFLLGK